MQPLDLLLNVYQTATESWIAEAMSAGTALFRRLAALEILVFGLIVALKAGRSGFEAIFPELTWKLFLIALLFTGLLLYPLWVPAIAPSFAQLAGQIGGSATLNPAVVIGQGIALAILILASGLGVGLIFPDLAGSVFVIFAALGVLFAFIAMGAVMARTLIESWFVLAAGPLFLGFSPFRLTAQLADNFLIYAFQVGIRLFFLILMTAAARGVAIEWAQAIITHGLTDYNALLEIMAGAILLAYILWTIPLKVADALTRGWQLGLRQGLGT
jgi:type IV secretion system protein TrbL